MHFESLRREKKMAFQFHLCSSSHYNLCHAHAHAHEHNKPLCNSHSPSHIIITQFSPSLFPWTSKSFNNNPLKLIISSLSTTQPPRCYSSSSTVPPLQDASVVVPEEEESENPNQEIKSSSTQKYIWVNPTSSRARELHQKSNDARYTFLMKLADSLNSCCNPTEADVSEILDRWLSDKKPVEEHDAIVLLNSIRNTETALIALKVFRQKLKTKREVVLYNVTLKVFRKIRDLDGAEMLFEEMLDRGVKPDKVTFSTLISCARLGARLDKAMEWFEMLPQFGYEPDDVINSSMIDVYGRMGNTKMSLSLYERARKRKWRIDIVTFVTVMKIYTALGNLDGALSVYADIKAFGMKPNTTVYNVMLDVLGKAKRPWQVKTVFQEMSDNGFSPNFPTYAALLRAYCKARFVEDALSIYKEMKEKDLVLNVILYNTLLAMCADMGCTDDAAEIYQDMKRSGNCVPDNWTFSSLITTYSSGGKVSEVEKVLNEMLEHGIEPDIFVLTSLVQCYGKANRTDDVLKTFDRLLELGITPDDRFCGCLLNVLNQSPKEEFGKLVSCISRANPKLGYVVKLLLGEETSDRGFKEEALELIESTGKGVKKAYCNGLMDLCVKLNLMERASELLELGLTLKIYIGIQSKSPTQWSLNLRSLSLGAALTALHIWMRDLSKVVDNEEEELPSLLGIDTGHGKNNYNKGLASEIASHLMELNSPFHEAPDNYGWFLTTKVAAESWLKSRSSHELVTA